MTSSTLAGSLEYLTAPSGLPSIITTTMPQPLFRTFSDATGRPWRVSELFAMPNPQASLDGFADSEPPSSLLFTSGNERRWVSHAPIQWWDVAEEKLIRLLADARALPHWVASFAGLVDE